MPRLAIIADDLTGALDAAAPFASAEVRVVVATRPEALAAALGAGAEVVAVSTRSREVAPGLAAARVARVLAGLPAGTRTLKKIDSRLKGNLAAELSAFGAAEFAVLPAIPEFGRIVQGGMVTGFGVEAPIPVVAALGAAAARARAPDVTSEAEMAAALRAVPEGAVLVGARGLAQALAREMGCRAADLPPLAPPLVVAVGSTDPITLAQVAALRAGRDDLAYIAAPSGSVPDGAALAPLTLVQAVPGPGRAAAAVAAEFARTAAPLLAKAASVVLTGGATAEAVLDALGIDRLEVLGEALPGMPLAHAGGQAFVTKSGGFGGPDAFLRLAAAVERAQAG